jgi:hypothetical protein
MVGVQMREEHCFQAGEVQPRGEHGLRRHAVAAVPAPTASGIMFLITQMAGHLLSQRPLQHRLGHLRQQPIRAQQLGTPGLSAVQQLIGQLVIDQRPAAGGPSRLRPIFAVSDITCPSASRPPGGSSSGHVTYTAIGHARADYEWLGMVCVS